MYAGAQGGTGTWSGSFLPPSRMLQEAEGVSTANEHLGCDFDAAAPDDAGCGDDANGSDHHDGDDDDCSGGGSVVVQPSSLVAPEASLCKRAKRDIPVLPR